TPACPSSWTSCSATTPTSKRRCAAGSPGSTTSATTATPRRSSPAPTPSGLRSSTTSRGPRRPAPSTPPASRSSTVSATSRRRDSSRAAWGSLTWATSATPSSPSGRAVPRRRSPSSACGTGDGQQATGNGVGMGERLGVGFIGSGFNARFHLQGFRGVRDADVLGVWSPNAKHAEETAALSRKLDVGETKPYNSIAAMVADPAIQALWLCGPNFARIENVEEIAHAVTGGKGALTGIACEKPRARNAAEEHSGPHMPWFWRGDLQGGGVLNDMMCHSALVVRHLLTKPGAARSTVSPKRITAQMASLKWTRPEYVKRLGQQMGPDVDYGKRPAEDFASLIVEFATDDGHKVLGEATTSWSFVGAGLRLSAELLGPEYSLSWNSLDAGLKLFFSREVKGKTGEDLVEKQNAE